jgi:hypothetical protein
MNPSLPFGPADRFYFEAFTQDEAFAAIDVENGRRGFFTVQPSPSTSSSSCISVPPAPNRIPQSVETSENCIATARAQQKWAMPPEQHVADAPLRFVRPWCREEVRAGRDAAVRKYVAASYCSMWHKTQSSLANCRHFYEIVRDSTPCHIYFDLEFATSGNENVDGNAKVDCLLNIVASLVRCVSSPLCCVRLHFPHKECSSWNRLMLHLQC